MLMRSANVMPTGRTEHHRAVSRRAQANVLTRLYIAVFSSAITACSGGNGQNHPAPPAPPPIPAAASPAANSPSRGEDFSSVVDEFRGIVNLLAETPPLSSGDGVRRALNRLAAAIERIPGPHEPARAEAVKLMQTRDFDVWVSLSRENAKAGPVRETLVIAAGALSLAAKDPSGSPAAEAASRLKRAVEDIDGTRPLSEERPRVLVALRAAVDVLTTLRDRTAGDRGSPQARAPNG
jgi:hypothetical protein